ncbi:hypothetical protein D3C76_1450710 [compost metagenome]
MGGFAGCEDLLQYGHRFRRLPAPGDIGDEAAGRSQLGEEARNRPFSPEAALDCYAQIERLVLRFGQRQTLLNEIGALMNAKQQGRRHFGGGKPHILHLAF